MEKLSIFHIEDASTSDANAFKVQLFPGRDLEDAIIAFNAMVFENNQGMLYKQLAKKVGKDDEWEANDDFTDCLVVTGDAERVACRAHYRWVKDKKGNIVKASPERIVRFVKLVAFKGDTIESQMARYLSQVPDNFYVEPEKKSKDKDEEEEE